MGPGGNIVVVPEEPSDVARMYLSPASGNYSAGSTVTMEIRVDSLDHEVNALDAHVSYPTDRLQWVSTSPGSAFTTVIQNAHSAGLIRFGAGILGGTTSGDQLIATVTFTALSAGLAQVGFEATSGVARASDSTNICESLDGASYAIT